MVKKVRFSTKFENQLATFNNSDADEEFIEADKYLENDALNEEQENFDENAYNEKDEELIEKLKSIDGKKRKRLRTELVKNELDVNITNNETGSINKIKAYDILNSLKNLPETSRLKKVLAKAHKRTKVLETPVPKYLSEKAQRIATYVQDKKEVSKWDPIVKKNRKSEQLIFPLKQPDYSMQTASSFTKAWKPETDLEKQVAELLQSSENNIKDQKLLTEAERKAVDAMNLDEMKQKRAEFLKLKALQSYQEAKFKRLKHIKSKRYRKILRLEREKNEEKKLTIMEKDDPAQFKEVLNEMEKKRMMERMSLKHKNTSKWSKQQVIYGKFNEKAREQVHEQLDISKKLTKKIKEFEYDDSDGETEQKQQQNETENVDLKSVLNKDGLLVNNPWIKMMSGVGGISNNNNSKIDEQDENDYSKPKAFVNEKEIKNAQNELDDEVEDNASDNNDDLDKSDLKEISKAFNNNDDTDEEEERQIVVEKKQIEKVVKKVSKKKIESEQLIETEKNLKPIVSKNISLENKSNLEQVSKKSDNKKHLMTLTDAFADDDVIDEFRQEKISVIENEKVKQIDLTMPGWGEWSGAGIDPSKQRKNKSNKKYRKKLILKPSEILTTKEDKEQMIRKDKDLEHVIISEKKDTKISAYQISDLPHQFKSVHEFESKIVQPIGRTWNPEHKFKKLTQPKLITRLGSVIEPIDRDDLNAKNIKKKS